MSGEPVESVKINEHISDKTKTLLEKLGDRCYKYSGWTKRNEECRKQIKEAKDVLNYSMLDETIWFDDVNGHIGDVYGNLGDLYPEVKVLFDFVEKVRRASFLLFDYHRDILYGNKMTVEDFQWLMMKVMEEEIVRYSDIREESNE
tara:strand:+ start:936 stop:1373 length:438 start_codon:yes stop_codon:yes gene_type:complete